MSPIPEERHAARDLERQFRALGERRAASRLHGRMPARRTLVIALLMLLLLAAAAAAGGLFTSGSGTEEGPGKLPPGLTRAPRDIALGLARANDPAGQFEWGMRRYTSKTGASCVVPGRLRAGQLVIPNGTALIALPRSAPGTCGRLSDSAPAVIARQIYGSTTGARTVLYGLVSRRVRDLALIDRGGRRRTIPIADDGTYIVVMVGTSALRGTVLQITTDRGTQTRHL